MSGSHANGRSWGRARLCCAGLALALAWTGGGCSHAFWRMDNEAAAGAAFLPRPPVFLTGPAVLLLTNATGFSARLTLTQVASNQSEPITGQLYVRGHRLRFDPKPASWQEARTWQVSYLWDASQGRGEELNEVVQGHAPVTGTASFTRLEIQGPAPARDKVSGHPVDQATVNVTADDGKASRFEVSRARDLGGLAVRIRSTGEGEPFTLTLSRIRLEPPAEGLFQPPQGFTAYPNETAMLTELTVREQGYYRKYWRWSSRRRHGGWDDSYHHRHRDTWP